ncbi:DNA polymerase epsilon subunit 4-like protein [Blastocystis sp. subtype 4]|uniref:DNA polymerase epsilon subunit 4-like protein n=1 Tax=Blastocystis sp. subtype 4 TaxID=944170 RepID=UPI000712067A|nr:DNA polymerase epsilon subunit 4-like protein [Blastocystis sp. subtype 4]KNB41236.1 DNA polymerase epsilon subunit 4-like protein [Blastocystis sp. subtype 4]|eukprot:XP_014524679.1 DNA polymerase epsilon subunit 4-like protein [Blastocystis sp. subtype 4]
MSDEEQMDAIEEDEVNTEVESLFMKTQVDSFDEESFYDMYVPLSVQLENDNWNNLYVSEPNETQDVEDSDSVVMPIARVKRIMKMDPEVNIISKRAVQIMSKATTLFIDMLANKLNARMKQDGTKTVKNSHLIQVCSQTPSLRFLVEDLTLEERDVKRVKVSQPQESQRTVKEPKSGITSFFHKR